jgi:hypothetical protein
MKKPTIDQMLIASIPSGGNQNHPFVQRVMQSIHQDRNGFGHALHALETPQKRTFLVRLRHLPKLTLLVLVILAMVVISGTAYAAYRLWLHPRTHTESFQENNKRIAAVVNLENCKDLGSQATFEIKRGSTLKPEEIDEVLQAKCELSAIENWSSTTWKADPLTMILTYPGGLTVQDISSNNVTFVEDSGDRQTYALTAETVFVEDGQLVSQKAIKKDDAVSTVVRHHYADENGGAPTKSELLAVVKLGLPARYYTSQVQNQIVQRAMCAGNAQETCTLGSLIDVFPGDEGQTLPYPRPSGDAFTIQGELVDTDGEYFTLKGSSGKLYTVQTTSNFISAFNANNSKDYGGLTIKRGDTLLVTYAQRSEADHQAIHPSEVLSVQLVTEITSKQDSLKKY